VTSDHLTIDTASDRDGWNVISTTAATITNATIHANDDALVFKSDYALGAKLPNGHVRVSGSTLGAKCCNALMFGSETCGDFSDYQFENIRIDGADKSGLGMVSMDGSKISDVHYRDITMTNVHSPIMQKIGTRKRCDQQCHVRQHHGDRQQPVLQPDPVGRVRAPHQRRDLHRRQHHGPRRQRHHVHRRARQRLDRLQPQEHRHPARLRLVPAQRRQRAVHRQLGQVRLERRPPRVHRQRGQRHPAHPRFDSAASWQPYAGPGGWNDLDSLEIGNGDQVGLTADQRRSHFTLWSMAAAPLLLGTDLTQLDSVDKAMLTNDRLIGVDQDGVAAKRIVNSGVKQVWSKKESDGQYVVALFNTGTSGNATVSVNWSQVGFSGSGDVTDLWSGSHKGVIADSYSATLRPGETRLIRVKPVNSLKAAAASPGFAVAPYEYLGWGSPQNPTSVMSATGVKWFTLAFILSDGTCNPKWDGSRPLTGGSDQSTINAIRGAGGDVVVSVGGWSGNKLGETCSSASALAGAYQKVINAYKLKALDIDIENTEWSNATVRQRVVDALKTVKANNPGLKTVITFGTTSSGPDSTGVDMIRRAANSGLANDVWCIMPFDFGGGTTNMGSLTTKAMEGLKAQVKSRTATATPPPTPTSGCRR